MAEIVLFGSEIITVCIISFLIFLSRIADVSFGTIRVVSISRGKKLLATIVGFFEITIWLVVINQVMSNFTNPIYYVAYALGFSIGTAVGITIEEKLNNGKVMVRIITKRSGYSLETEIEKINCCSISSVDGVSNNYESGVPHDVKIMFIIVKRKKLAKVLDILRHYDPKAKYSVEDIRLATDEFPEIKQNIKKPITRFGFFRKAK